MGRLGRWHLSRDLPGMKEPRGLRRRSFHQEEKHKRLSYEQVCCASWCPTRRGCSGSAHNYRVHKKHAECFESSAPSPRPAHRTWGGSLQHVRRILGPGCLLCLCRLCLKKEEEGARIWERSQELAVDLVILRCQLGALVVVLEGLCKDGIQSQGSGMTC